MLFIYIGLIAFGCCLIYNEKKLINFERETLNKIKEVVKKMKYFYIVVTVSENEKCYSYVTKVNSGDNLLSKLKIKNIITADIHETKNARTK